MVDRTGSSALTQLIQDSIGKHLRSEYEIEQNIPEHIFRLLQLTEEKAPTPGGHNDPSPRGSSDDAKKS
jgi:hypothetical protein